MSLNYPPNYQTTSTTEKLGSKPQDMPDRGGPKVNYQSTSSMETLKRNPHPVAAFGARPGMGEVQTGSTRLSLNRNANSPYDNISATTPQIPGRGNKKK